MDAGKRAPVCVRRKLARLLLLSSTLQALLWDLVGPHSPIASCCGCATSQPPPHAPASHVHSGHKRTPTIEARHTQNRRLRGRCVPRAPQGPLLSPRPAPGRGTKPERQLIPPLSFRLHRTCCCSRRGRRRALHRCLHTPSRPQPVRRGTSLAPPPTYPAPCLCVRLQVPRCY